MGVSKVILNGDTLMDVTGKTVDTDNLLYGETALRNDGESITGAVVTAAASDTDPAMDGTASAGSASTYSRGDHVHPTDTTKQDKITASGILKGNGSGGVSAAVAGTDYISSESDPTVPSWAKQSSKPTYTASEVGALPDSTDVTKWNDVSLTKNTYTNSDSQYYIPVLSSTSATQSKLVYATPTPSGGKISTYDSSNYLHSTTPSASDNSTKVATTAYVDNAIPSAVTNTYSNDNKSGNILLYSSQSSTSTVTATQTSGALKFSSSGELQVGKAHSDEGTKGSLTLSNTAASNGYTTITPSATTNITLTLPNASGTLALSGEGGLPSQSGQSGKFLTTDGTDASWASVTVPTKTSDLINDSGFITGYTETDPTVPSWAKQPNKPTYTATEVGALPNTTTIPTYTSQLVNNSGFITGYTETDPTVPSWAKQPNKPSYTATEVGALPNTTTIPAYTSQLVNNSGFITASDLSCKSVPFRDKKIVYLNGINSSTYANNGWALIIWTSGQGVAYTQAGGVVMWNAATPAYCNFGSSSFNYVGYASNYSRVQITLNASYNCHGVVITSGGTDVTFA